MAAFPRMSRRSLNDEKASRRSSFIDSVEWAGRRAKSTGRCLENFSIRASSRSLVSRYERLESSSNVSWVFHGIIHPLYPSTARVERLPREFRVLSSCTRSKLFPARGFEGKKTPGGWVIGWDSCTMKLENVGSNVGCWFIMNIVFLCGKLCIKGLNFKFHTRKFRFWFILKNWSKNKWSCSNLYGEFANLRGNWLFNWRLERLTMLVLGQSFRNSLAVSFCSYSFKGIGEETNGQEFSGTINSCQWREKSLLFVSVEGPSPGNLPTFRG